MTRSKHTLHTCLSALGFPVELRSRDYPEAARVFHTSIGKYVKEHPDYDHAQDANQFVSRASAWVELNSEKIDNIKPLTSAITGREVLSSEKESVVEWVMYIMLIEAYSLHLRRLEPAVPEADPNSSPANQPNDSSRDAVSQALSNATSSIIDKPQSSTDSKHIGIAHKAGDNISDDEETRQSLEKVKRTTAKRLMHDIHEDDGLEVTEEKITKRTRSGFEVRTIVTKNPPTRLIFPNSQHSSTVEPDDGGVGDSDPQQTTSSANEFSMAAPGTAAQPLPACSASLSPIGFTQDQFDRTKFLVYKRYSPPWARALHLHECLTWESFVGKILDLLELTRTPDHVKLILVKFDGFERKQVISSPAQHHSLLVDIQYWGGWQSQPKVGTCVVDVEIVLEGEGS